MQLWTESVTTHERVFNYSNELILNEIEQLVNEQSHSQVRLLDLGCVASAILFYFLAHLAPTTLGIVVTLS